MNIVFFLYDGMTALDAIGPHEILCRVPNARVKRVASKSGLIISESSQLTLLAEYSLDEVDEADVLVIPGAGNATSLKDQPNILAWIRKLHATTQYTTSVCTGSLILGAAGLLQGVQATTHWAVMDRLAGWGAKPVPNRIVTSGKIMTAAGVSAGIDMALWLVSILSGRPAAESIQLGIEYDPEPPFNSGSPSKADPGILHKLRQRLIAQFEK